MTSIRNEHLALIPAHNDAAAVAGLVNRVRAGAPYCDVLVVDDGSLDDTATRAEEAGADLLRLPFSLGLGGAAQAGFVYASEHGYRRVVQIDGNGAPDEIARLLAAMVADPSLDMVCGSRFLDSAAPPVPRRVSGRLFAWLVSRIVGQRITDPTSGFRAYNQRTIELFSADYPHDYPEVEAVVMLQSHRVRMAEVPVRMFERSGRSASRSLRSASHLGKLLLAIFVGLLRRRSVPKPGEPAAVAAKQGI